MAARYFCDGCGEEIVPARRTFRDQQGRVFGRTNIPGGKTMFVQVLVGTNQTWNDGDFCNPCIAACLASALGRTETWVSPIAPPHGERQAAGAVARTEGEVTGGPRAEKETDRFTRTTTEEQFGGVVPNRGSR